MLIYIHTYIHTNTHTHIRTTEAYLYYKLTNEPKGSGELKSSSKHESVKKSLLPLFTWSDSRKVGNSSILLVLQ